MLTAGDKMRIAVKGFGRVLALALALAGPPAPADAARPAAPARAERPVPVVPARLVGRWADSDDCAKFVILRSDGTFLGHDGGQGSWRLVRNRLTLTGARETVALTIRSLTATRMVVANPDGTTGASRRC
jgi:hypothetical protein